MLKFLHERHEKNSLYFELGISSLIIIAFLLSQIVAFYSRDFSLAHTQTNTSIVL